MELCHPHNLDSPPATAKPYGIRISLLAGDSFSRLLGADWQAQHWFGSEKQRDRALEEMASEHLYSRRGDRPTLRFERVEAPEAASAREN